ncbi:MAG: hypothetical protein PHW10_00275 [Candidatus Peribacteraceae bacterium]|nr:hypothetical protein [Candidatus Peribacteraceae bacterium]
MSGTRNRNREITPTALEDQAKVLFGDLFQDEPIPVRQIQAITEEVGSRLIRGREHLLETSEEILADLDRRAQQPENGGDLNHALIAVRSAVHLVVTNLLQDTPSFPSADPSLAPESRDH